MEIRTKTGPICTAEFPRVIIAVLLILGGGMIAVGCSDPDPSRVILISLDTLRADRLGCYGFDREISPFLDSLADRGVLFENAIAQAPGTLPSHISMLTGLLPSEHDVFPPDGRLSEEIPLISELLSARGIHTGAFTEGGYVKGVFGFDRGFDVFSDESEKRDTDIEDILRDGLDFISSAGDGDFFLFLHTYSVHDPYFPPLPYTADFLPELQSDPRVGRFGRFSASDLVLSEEDSQTQQDLRMASTISLIEELCSEELPLPTGPNLAKLNRDGNLSGASAHATRDFYSALYNASIRYVDDVLRAFFEELERRGELDGTVVIITSDHGEELLEHGRFAHEQIYRECVHVPLLVVGAGVPQGARVRGPVMLVDVPATIMDLFGVSDFKSSGVSLRESFAGGSADRVRDAHTLGIGDPGESLHRLSGETLYQFVVHHRGTEANGLWVSREIEFDTTEGALQLDISSFHRDRRVSVTVNGVVLKELTVGEAGRRLDLDLNSVDTERNQWTVKLTGDSCSVPSELGLNNDQRCLSFRLSGIPGRYDELFNLDRDPTGQVNIAMDNQTLAGSMTQGLESFHLDPVARSETIVVDEETTERLRALGYVP
jgi:Sulfatase